MNKKLLSLFLMSIFVLGSASIAHASILINFDAPTFTIEAAGDHSHTVNTTYGDIVFNGRINNEFAGNVVSDHTTGSGYFLKNSGGPTGVDILTMTFAFDVSEFDLWLRGTTGTQFRGKALDINGQKIGTTQIWTGNNAWFHEATGASLTPIRSLVVWSTVGTGNNIAIDDVNIKPWESSAAVPEPATMSLLGLGLLGLVGFGKRRHA